MDALNDDKVLEVYFQKPVQCGGSEAGRNALGCWIDTDPGPVLIVFPSEDSAKENIDERIIPMFRDSPQLTRHLTGRPWDVKKGVINLRACSVYAGWSGSPQALASRPIRFLVLDECDKFARWRGVEADPISLAKDRTLTYRHRRKVFALSTPTVPTGPIAKGLEACGAVRDYCPKCPECQTHFVPDWARVSWKGQDAADEEQIRAVRRKLDNGETVAHYACPHCEAALAQPAFWEAVKAGEWISRGFEPGDHPRSDSVGFALSGLCSPWIGVQKCARSSPGPGSRAWGRFRTSTGVPFWSADTAGDPNLQVTQQRVWELANSGGPQGSVPEWATCVVAGVDTGKRDHPYVVRAFGPGFRSQLLEQGLLKSGDQVLGLLERTWHGPGGHAFPIRRMLIDSGGGAGLSTMTRTEEVYRLAQKDPARIYACKGHGGTGNLAQPIQTRAVHYRPPGDKYGQTLEVRLSTLDVGYWKDLTASYITQGIWCPYPGVGKDYVAQVASERKILVETKIKSDQTAVEVWRWVVKAAGLPNHAWDCEVLATVAAHMVGADQITLEPDIPEPADDYEGGWGNPSRYTRTGTWN
jgi:phage terminase large subunit GpA-like protein